MKVMDTLKEAKIAYLGGDDAWYVTTYNEDFPAPGNPITVRGPLTTILDLAAGIEFNIVPEAQNMIDYDATGVATVTLSPYRMDANITVANANDFISGSSSIVYRTISVSLTNLLSEPEWIFYRWLGKRDGGDNLIYLDDDVQIAVNASDETVFSVPCFEDFRVGVYIYGQLNRVENTNFDFPGGSDNVLVNYSDSTVGVYLYLDDITKDGNIALRLFAS